MDLKFTRLTLLFGLLLFCAGASYAQNQTALKIKETNLTINVRNESLQSVLNTLHQLSGCNFLYDQRVAENSPAITLDMKNVGLAAILNRIGQITALKYSRVDNTFTFSSAKQDASSTASKTSIVRGQVVDEKSNPMIGATVMVKGTQTGTITDVKGNFTINAAPSDVLRVSFLGYKDTEMSVGERTNLKIILQEDNRTVEEVVVVGYGTQKRASLTGAVSTVKGSDMAKIPIASTSNALTGRVSGLITTQTSGQPGADAANLSIRGFDAPLVIVDGVEGNFNNINTGEIESISVLKDASAAIYGARAGNGVILVTTKRGTDSKPTITFNSAWTFQKATDMAKPLAAGDYTRFRRDIHLQNGLSPDTAPFTEEQIAKYYAGNDPDYPSTNWYDYVMRDYSPAQQYDLSLRGGSNKIKYYGFFGYLNQETMVKRNGGNYDRYNLRSNIDAQVLENLVMSVDISTIIEARRYPMNKLGEDEKNGNIWLDLMQTMPYYPTSLPDPTKLVYAGSTTGGAHISSNRALGGTNDRFNQSLRAQASLKYDVKQLPGLSAKASYIYDKGFQKTKMFPKKSETYSYSHSADMYTKHSVGVDPYLNQSASESSMTTGQFSLNYDNTFAEKHSLQVLALYELIETASENLSGQREGFLTQNIPYLYAGGVDNQQATSSGGEMGRASWIGRLNYGYDSKYLIEATIRYDGSAQFPKDSRWGLFPSVSAGWRMSEEAFIKDNSQWVSNLKIRGGYSQTGNDNVIVDGALIDFPYLSGYNQGYGYVIGDQTLASYYLRGMANPYLTWETMNLANVGIDFGFINNSIYGEADFFYRTRDGIPGRRNNSMPDTFGEKLPVENLNKISTRGFELSLGYRNSYKDFYYDVAANVSWSRSKWDYYNEPTYTDPDDINQKQITGHWTDRTFGYLSNGLFTSLRQINDLAYSYEEVQGNNSGLRKGDIILLNTNGDGVLNWRDKVELGEGTTPHWMMGMNINLGYKGISVSMLWQGAFGFYKNISGIADANEIGFRERWTDDNNRPNALIPRLGTLAAMYFGSSDYFLKPADYLRLKNLSVGYSLPTKWLKSIKIEEVRVFFAGTNLLTFSGLNKYNIDPEAPSSKPTLYYPQMKTLSFGFNLSF